jgi:ABC-2 type transport system ATP-binding protein
MHRLGKEKTILLSTHILQEAEATASRVIVIDQGRLVADAPLAEFTQGDKTLGSEFQRLTAAAS